jgi:PAS domain S-box-containing protein
LGGRREAPRVPSARLGAGFPRMLPRMVEPSEFPVSPEKRLQMLVAGIRDYAIYLLDPQGRIASWNAGAERFKGYTADEVMGEHFSRFFTPEDREAGLPAKALQKAQDEGKFESEGWRVRKDGSRFWANVVVDAIRDERGRLVGFAKITRDVTERRNAQEALRESEQQFTLLVNGISDYAVYMLSPEGNVTNWNPGAQRIKGYSAEEVIGSHFSRFYTPEDQASGQPARSLATAASEGRFHTEGWRMRKDGSRFWANVVIDAIHDDQGKLIGFAKITRDVTEQREASEALQRANAALFHSQKLQAIGHLTGGIAHDFNNLLAVVSSGLDVLSMSQGRVEPQLLEAMRRAVQRGSNLTQQLLAFARKQPLQPEPCNVNALIHGFESVLRRAVDSSIAFAIELDPAMGTVALDGQRFEAALLNLVVNARDAMPDGGKLLLKTGMVELKAEEVGTLPAGRYLQVLVVDSGQGMDADTLQRAVEPFFTTKDVGKGTGLGLSQVHGFITQSGGELVLNSTAGEGTVVGIYLPLLDLPVPATTRRPLVERVLVVEDEPELLGLASSLFRSIGYDVLTASNGADARLVIERDPQAVDIVFSDVVMPGISGMELAQWVRQEHPHIKVVLTSGYAQPALAAEHERIKDYAFVGKPYRLPDLARALRNA